MCSFCFWAEFFVKFGVVNFSLDSGVRVNEMPTSLQFFDDSWSVSAGFNMADELTGFLRIYSTEKIV